MIFFGALSKFTKTFFSVHINTKGSHWTMSSINPGVPISTGLYVVTPAHSHASLSFSPRRLQGFNQTAPVFLIVGNSVMTY